MSNRGGTDFARALVDSKRDSSSGLAHGELARSGIVNATSPWRRKPAYRFFGQGLLLAIVISLLAGTFSLANISPDLDWLDIRLVGCYVVLVGFTVWVLGSRAHWPHDRPVVRSIWWFYAWAAWMALTADWSPNGARVKDSLVGLCAMVLLVTMAAQVVKRLESEDLNFIWSALLFIAMLYFVAAIRAGPGVQGRYSAFGGGPNVFVRVLVIGALSALLLYLRDGHIFALVTLPFLAIGAVLSGSRGGLVASGAVVLVGTVPIVRRLGLRRSVSAVTFTSMGLGLFLLFGGSSTIGFLQQRFIEQTLVQGYSSDRVSISEQVIGLFESHIWFGTGVDGYFAVVGQYIGAEYPHNLFLASAAEGGLIGVGLVTFAIVALNRAVLKSRPISLNTLFAWLCAILLLVASQFSGDYYDSRMMWFFFVVAAVDAARPDSSRDSRTPGVPRT
jgi:O-antigen ligase